MDTRWIQTGSPIPSEDYADQPYVVKTDDGAWLLVMTTGSGHEGDPGQHVVTMRSRDFGKSWEPPVDVEPKAGPEASYAVMLKARSGRIYCFYNHNTDRVKEVRREDSGVYKRVDSLGHFVFKYSDDHGRTWSRERYEVPVREFDCDRKNVYGGKLRFFWNVGRPVVHRDAALVPLHKVGAMGAGFFAQSEGAFLRSPNILTEADPGKITWETLPDGEVGLRTPRGGGRVSEEQSLSVMSDGSLYCVYRSIDGWPVESYSRDGGHTWSAPQYKARTPGGRRMKHPRAANFAWRCANGKYLYWYHNHGGAATRTLPAPWDPYADRNPVWLAAGVERPGQDGPVIHWSEPEIALYDDDPYIRMSYPDLIEEDGRYFLTETQKTVGRVHEVDSGLIAGLFNQWDAESIPTQGLLLERTTPPARGEQIVLPKLPEFVSRDSARADFGTRDNRAGISVAFWLRVTSYLPGQVLLTNRTPQGHGFSLELGEGGRLIARFGDGRTANEWSSDAGVVKTGASQHVVWTLDGGPKVTYFVVDGKLNDGGDERQFGWGRWSPNLRSLNGSRELRVAQGDGSAVETLRIYGRALRVSEAVSSFQATRRHRK